MQNYFLTSDIPKDLRNSECFDLKWSDQRPVITCSIKNPIHENKIEGKSALQWASEHDYQIKVPICQKYRSRFFGIVV